MYGNRERERFRLWSTHLISLETSFLRTPQPHRPCHLIFFRCLSARFSMEYKEVEGVQGGVPKFGAIFMSNIVTKEECFRWKILGLPSAQANFVKQVKAGMVLFLFEFERRELHGVFRASSDGVMNLVPHAFSSSGSQFPAQVRFTPIWYCSPLSEHEFRDAIKENYFSRNKFNFGLSEDQVCRLLWLFNSRKLENEQLPERQFSRQASEPIGKDRREAGNDRIFVRNSAEKFVKEDGLNPSINTKFYENSSSNVRRPSSNVRRLYDDRFLKSDGTENELSSDNYHGNDILTEQPRTSLGKRRDDDGRSSMQDRIEYDCDVDNICIDHPGDSLCKSGREAEESQLLPSDRIEIKRIMDRNIGSIFTSEYLADSLAKVQRATDDVRFPVRDILGDKRTPDNGFGLVTSTDHLENPDIKARRTTDDHRFFMDCRVENNCNLDNGLEPIISTDCQENLLGGVRRTSDDGKFVLNGRMESEHHVDNGLRPFLLAKYLENPLGKVEKETDNAMFLMSDRVGMGNEHFANQLDYVRKENDRDRFLARMSMENEHKVGNNLGQVISTVHSGYPLDKIRRVADEGMSLNIDRVDNAFNMENCFGPPLSTGFSDFCQSRQNPSFYSSKPQSETNYSLCQDQQKPCSAFPRSMEQKTFEFPYPISHDAIVTRAFPYDPEFPDIHHRRSSSVAVDCISSHSVRDFTPHRSSFGNVFDSSVKRASPYRLEAKDLSQNLDVASNCVNKVSLPTNPNHSLLSGGSYGKVEARVTGHEVYKEPLFSKSSSASIPISRSEIYERQAKSPYVEFGKHGDASQSRYKHKIPQHETNQAFRIKDAPSFDNNMGDLQSGSSHEKSYNSYIEYYQHSKGMCADSKSERISVFSRLTSVSELPGQENDTSDCDECDTDASVDQVMDMLHQRLNHRIMKPGKLPLVRRHDMENMPRTKMRDMIYNQIECDKLTMMKNDLEQVIDDNCDDIAKETHVVDFRRRSETRKIQGGTKTKGSVKTVVDETKGSVQKPEHKRRKLVRPVFGKKEQLDEGLSSDGNSNLQLSWDDSVKSQENESRSSPNDLLVQLTSTTSCGGDSANVEQSSNCREKNSENCELVWLVSSRKELLHEDINNNGSLNLQLYSHEGSITKENTESCGNICDVGNTNGDSSDCRERNAVNGGSLLTCDEGKDGKKSCT